MNKFNYQYRYKVHSPSNIPVGKLLIESSLGRSTSCMIFPTTSVFVLNHGLQCHVSASSFNFFISSFVISTSWPLSFNIVVNLSNESVTSVKHICLNWWRDNGIKARGQNKCNPLTILTMSRLVDRNHRKLILFCAVYVKVYRI